MSSPAARTEFGSASPVPLITGTSASPSSYSLSLTSSSTGFPDSKRILSKDATGGAPSGPGVKQGKSYTMVVSSTEIAVSRAPLETLEEGVIVIEESTPNDPPSSDIVELDDKNFKETVLKSDGVWLVEFYAPWCGHCKNLKNDWDKSASALKGVVGVAAVDATASQALASKYGIQGFPSIKVFGADKRNPTDYQGERTASAIVSGGMAAARDLVKSRQSGGSSKKPKTESKSSSNSGPKKKKTKSSGGSAVVELNENNFKEMVLQSDEMWLVEFFAPWCGHCQKLAPEWESAAGQLQGTVNLGAVDATQHQNLAQKYGVQGYPTIKAFPPGPKKGPQDYNGPREAEGIVAYATQMLESSGWVPKVPQLTGRDVIDEKCGGTKICVIAALPHILDSGKAGREEYIEKVRGAAKKSRNAYLSVIWTEGGAQPALEEATGLTFGFPAVVAISIEKKAFAVHVGSFSVNGMADFLVGLTTGATRTKPLDELPKIVLVEPWDEKDATAVEEEFSLEDLFGDDLPGSKDEL